MTSWRGVKLGWYVLLALVLYSMITTIALLRSNRLLRDTRNAVVANALSEETKQDVGLWFPIPGARLPQDSAYLPSAPRVYRRGVNQGFDFYSEDAGIPIPYGMPVIAAANGMIVRVDNDYQEQAPESWQALIEAVSQDGANESQLNHLRGRQVWLETDDGLILRYAHLSGLRQGLTVGQRVFQGQVLAYVGNSGTDDGVAGTIRGARLHFEIWRRDGSFFGQNLASEEVRREAAALFVGP